MKTVCKFVVMTFCLSWLLWGSIIFANQLGYLKTTSSELNETVLRMALLGIGACGPAISAIIVLSKDKGTPKKQIFKNIFAVKQPVLMYLITIGFLALYFIAGTLTGFMEFNGSPIYLSLLTFPIMIVGGGFEEVGWRFFQPELERKLPFPIACSITAVVWSTWHLPLFFMEGTNQFTANFGLFTIMVFGLAFALAAIYYVSKSVWLCIFFHTMTNCLYESFTIKNSDVSKDLATSVITTGLLIIASISVVSIVNRRQRKST